jgi:hypothetical protein
MKALFDYRPYDSLIFAILLYYQIRNGNCLKEDILYHGQHESLFIPVKSLSTTTVEFQGEAVALQRKVFCCQQVKGWMPLEVLIN